MGSRCLRVRALGHFARGTCTPSAPSSTSVKAFDTSWVEATLVRLHQVGGHWRHVAYSGQFPLWHPLAGPSLRGTYLRRGSTRVLLRDVCSHHFFSTYWSTALQPPSRRASPGVRLVPHSDLRFTCQLYADDLVLLADSEADLQAALDAVTQWGPSVEIFLSNRP